MFALTPNPPTWGPEGRGLAHVCLPVACAEGPNRRTCVPAAPAGSSGSLELGATFSPHPAVSGPPPWASVGGSRLRGSGKGPGGGLRPDRKRVFSADRKASVRPGPRPHLRPGSRPRVWPCGRGPRLEGAVAEQWREGGWPQEAPAHPTPAYAQPRLPGNLSCCPTLPAAHRARWPLVTQLRHPSGERVAGRACGMPEDASGPPRELRPRLCHLRKGPQGYGFNLHSDKSRPGQYIRSVDIGSPAAHSGLRAQDRLIEVNGQNVEGLRHAEVVASIKAREDEARLLVVDPETDEHFKRLRVTPTEEHVEGPLPSPATNGTSPTQDSMWKHDPFQESGLHLSPTAAEAKEKARATRVNKRAPQMDWNRKREIFSNF